MKFYARIEGVLLAYFEGSRRRRLFPARMFPNQALLINISRAFNASR